LVNQSVAPSPSATPATLVWGCSYQLHRHEPLVGGSTAWPCSPRRSDS
jgi:hypothetical protein